MTRYLLLVTALFATACASVFAHEDSYVATRKRWCAELASRAYSTRAQRDSALLSVPDALHPSVTCAVVLGQ